MNKNGMMESLNGMVYALIVFAVIIGVGSVVLVNFGNSVVNCAGVVESGVATNVSAWLNGSGYNTNSSNYYAFTPTITNVVNATGGESIVLANVSTLGSVFYNTTAVVWENANISYTYTWDNRHYWNTSSQTCLNAIGAESSAGTGTAYTSIAYMLTNLGSGGLAGWVPAIIAISIGLLFLGAFIMKGGKKKR